MLNGVQFGYMKWAHNFYHDTNDIYDISQQTYQKKKTKKVILVKDKLTISQML